MAKALVCSLFFMMWAGGLATGCKQSVSTVKDVAPDGQGDPGGIKVGPVGEDDMKELQALRDDFLNNVKSKADLDAFIGRVAEKYKTAPPNVKLVSAHILLLKPFRSIVYRAAPILERTNASHSAMLTLVQQSAASIKTYLPTQQWEAVLNYVTEPFDKNTARFSSIHEMQDEVESQVIPMMVGLAKDLEGLNLTDGNPAVWDNRMLYGPASFRDARDRFVKLGVAEKWSAVGNFYTYLVSARAFCSFNLDDLPAVAQSVGSLAGIDGFLGGAVRGSPLKLRAQQIKAFPNFLALRTGTGAPAAEPAAPGSAGLDDPQAQPTSTEAANATGTTPPPATVAATGNGAVLMKAALEDLKNAVAAMRKSFDATVARQSALGGQVDEFFAIRPDRAMPSQRPTDLALKDMESLVAGKAKLYSAISSDEIAVDVPNFFNNPPRNLQSLLPEQFDESDSKTVDGVQVRNYLWGSPTGWRLDAYQPYFPELTNGGDVAAASRTLAQSWGGTMVNLPLMSFVN